MEKQLNFSLSYELLFQVTEAQIKKCNLSMKGPHYAEELTKASDFLNFWHKLAHRGLGDYERIDADWQHLHAIIYKKEK